VQQDYEVPEVSLSIAPANMEVTVRPTDLIAAEQIRAEEKQRLAGRDPNFYTSYIHDAAPLNWKQKFSLGGTERFRSRCLPRRRLRRRHRNRRRTPIPGTGKVLRDIASVMRQRLSTGRSSDFLTNALFPALFHQDPRYYYRGSGSFKSRLLHAVSSVFAARSDTGRTVPNSSYLLGDLSAAALSTLY